MARPPVLQKLVASNQCRSVSHYGDAVRPPLNSVGSNGSAPLAAADGAAVVEAAPVEFAFVAAAVVGVAGGVAVVVGLAVGGAIGNRCESGPAEFTAAVEGAAVRRVLCAIRPTQLAIIR